MSNRRSFFFRQRVTEEELNSALDDLELADQHLAGDLSFVGVLANAAVSPHAPVADLTVDVSGPASILDQLGRRVFFSSLQNVNVAQDDNGVATAVAAAGKERIVSVFIRFERLLSDPRVDGNSLTVFFRRDESFKFIVAQGAEANAGGAAPPQLRFDAILLADVVRRFEQAQILGDSISTARRQDAFAIAGAPRSLRRGRTAEVAADLLGFHNAHVVGSSDRHAGGAIDYDGGDPWADGSLNPASTVGEMVNKIVADLAGPGGAAKVGAAAKDGAPVALARGSVKSQVDTLLAALNAHVATANGAHPASAVVYGGGPNWKDGVPNPAAPLEAHLDKLIEDLAGDSGAAKLGTGQRPPWLGGRENPAGGSVLAALAKIVTDLSDQGAGEDGAARIGAQAVGNLAAGSVRSQLTALDATSVRTNVASVFTAKQTMNGAAGDTNAALATSVRPGARKLLWEIAGADGAYSYRLYAGRLAFEISVNARWDGIRWIKDVDGTASSKLEMGTGGLNLQSDDGPASQVADSWPNSVFLGIVGHKQQSLDAGGNWTSAGPTETYVGWQGSSGNAVTIGTGAPFRKMFPATPSSITVVVLVSQNLQTAPVAFAPAPSGTGVVVNTASFNNSTLFFARVIAS
jgi:hypothetical protein